MYVLSVQVTYLSHLMDEFSVHETTDYLAAFSYHETTVKCIFLGHTSLLHVLCVEVNKPFSDCMRKRNEKFLPGES